MNKVALLELAERVEKAGGPDRELDGAICLALGWTLQKMKGDSRPYYRKPGEAAYYMRSEPLAFTSSFDSAMTLVPEGWSKQVSLSENGQHATAVLGRSYPTNKSVYQDGRTMPLAMCVAALRARAEMEPS